MPTQTISYVIRDSLYLNITDRCTLRCRFCPKNRGTYQVQQYDLRLCHKPAREELIAAIGDPRQYREVVFCGYGEPTLRLKVMLAVADYVKTHSGQVRLNTNGLANLVHKRNVLPEMSGLIDAVSISMNAAQPDVYERHCRPLLPGAYNAMLAFLAQAIRYIPVVTATAIDGLEDVDIRECARIASRLGAGFRKRELDIVG